YHAYAKREHRWVRGDWQLLPWLGWRMPIAGSPRPEGARADSAPAGRGELPRKVRNVLPLVQRWKVFDNLRRSLTPPALLVLFLLGWTVLPGAPGFWTLVGLAVPF